MAKSRDILKQGFSTTYRVVICPKERIIELLPLMIERAGFEIGEYKLVLVKPNLCGMYYPDTRLIEEVLRIFEPYARKIIIGETNSMMHTPERQFRRFGIYDLIKKFGEKVEALNLMKDEILSLDVPSPHVIKRLPIPKLVNECDLLINIPKVGTHSNTKLTCALKNLFGLLAESNKYGVYHRLGVDKVIADLVKIVKCDLNVVDVGEKVMVGVDPLAIDIVACSFVGLDPLKVEHLRLVSEDRNLKLEEIMRRLQVIEM